MQKFFPAAHDYEVIHRNLYVTHQRVAATFRKGRVVLAGDSAHVNNPIGGMGLNGGLQDGANLSDKLARILLDGAPDRLLDLYDRQRRTVAVEFVQEQSIANKKRLEASDPEVRKRNLDDLRAMAADPERARQFLLRTSMIASQRRADVARTGGRMTMLAPEQTARPTLRPVPGAPRSNSPPAPAPRGISSKACLVEFANREKDVGAFVSFDIEGARAAADALDRALERRQAGCRRSTACRWASRTSSRPPTCRPRWARRCSRAGARRRTPPASRRCGRPAPSSSARP